MGVDRWRVFLWRCGAFWGVWRGALKRGQGASRGELARGVRAVNPGRDREPLRVGNIWQMAKYGMIWGARS